MSSSTALNYHLSPAPHASIFGFTGMAAIRGVMAPWSSITLNKMMFSNFKQAVDC
jgi:hypothetical protein